MSNRYKFPHGKYEGQYISDCSDTKELSKFIYYGFRPLKNAVRSRLHQLNYTIDEEPRPKKERKHVYHFPDKAKINVKGKLIFTCCQQNRKRNIYYAVQIYRCYENKLVWLYTLNPPTDKLGEKVNLRGTICHKSRYGFPITLLVQNNYE